MSDMLYVGLQDDDKVVVFALDGDGGKLKFDKQPASEMVTV